MSRDSTRERRSEIEREQLSQYQSLVDGVSRRPSRVIDGKREKEVLKFDGGEVGTTTFSQFLYGTLLKRGYAVVIGMGINFVDAPTNLRRPRLQLGKGRMHER